MATNFFNVNSNLYSSEKNLFDLLATECINFHGICCEYYLTTWDENHNRIWGEDMDRFYVRSFDFMSMMEIPQEIGIHSVQGLNLQDMFHLYVTFKHFQAASGFGEGNVSFQPKTGDVIKTKFNERFWEIVDVGQETPDMHLQTKHAWDITVIPWINEQISLTADTTIIDEPLIEQLSTSDIFDISEEINNKKDVIEQSNNTELSGWW